MIIKIKISYLNEQVWKEEFYKQIILNTKALKRINVKNEW
jgi:hypothetical protein